MTEESIPFNRLLLREIFVLKIAGQQIVAFFGIFTNFSQSNHSIVKKNAFPRVLKA